MANGAIGSIIVNIQAQVTNFQSEIDKIKKALQQINPGSEVGKVLTRQLAQAESVVKSLGKDINKRISSSSQLTGLFDKLGNVNEIFQSIGQSMAQVNWRDMMGGAAEEIKGIATEIQNIRQEIVNNTQGIWDNVLKDIPEVKNVFKELKVDPKKMGIDEFATKLDEAISQSERRIKDLQGQQEKLTQDINTKQAQLSTYNKLAPELQGGVTRSDIAKMAGRNAIVAKAPSPHTLMVENYQEMVKQFEQQLKSQLGKPGVDDSRSAEALARIGPELEAKFTELKEAKTTEVVEEIVRNIDRILKTGTTTGAAGGKQLKGLTGMNVSQWTDQFIMQGQSAVQKDSLLNARERFQGWANSLKESGLDTTAIQDAINNLIPIESTQELQNRFDLVVRLLTEGARRVGDKAKSTAQDIEKLSEQRGSLGQQITSLTDQKNQYEQNRSAVDPYVKQLENTVKEQGERIKELETKIQQITEKADREQSAPLANEGSNLAISSENQLRANAEAAKMYSDELKRVKDREQMLGKISGILQRWVGIYAAVRLVGNAFRSIKSTLQELDKTITEIAIVTDKTQGQLWGQMSSYTSMAKQYASSISGVYQVSQLYYQQGLGQSDVMALTEQTLKMARISGLDYAQATDYMTNAVRSFKMEMEDSQRVVDVYSAIAASSATSTTELASAMSKTASSAEAVGSSFENTTAMMAVMIEATRESAENIGSAMKSIISRYGEMTSDPSALVDSEGEEMSLNRVDKALQTVGISIHDTAGQFRDFDDVIMELASKWDTIDTNTQRYIATIMAGNRQQSRFLALVSNYERLSELSDTAANSEDASQLQVLKTMDSIEAKSQQLQTSLQSLYTESGFEDLYKGLLDGLKNVIDYFNGLPKIFGKIPAGIVVVFSSLFTTISLLAKKFSESLQNTITAAYDKITTKQENQANILAQQYQQEENQQNHLANNEQNIQEQQIQQQQQQQRQAEREQAPQSSLLQRLFPRKRQQNIHSATDEVLPPDIPDSSEQVIPLDAHVTTSSAQIGQEVQTAVNEIPQSEKEIPVNVELQGAQVIKADLKELQVAMTNLHDNQGAENFYHEFNQKLNKLSEDASYNITGNIFGKDNSFFVHLADLNNKYKALDSVNNRDQNFKDNLEATKEPDYQFTTEEIDNFANTEREVLNNQIDDLYTTIIEQIEQAKTRAAETLQQQMDKIQANEPVQEQGPPKPEEAPSVPEQPDNVEPDSGEAQEQLQGLGTAAEAAAEAVDNLSESTERVIENQEDREEQPKPSQPEQPSSENLPVQEQPEVPETNEEPENDEASANLQRLAENAGAAADNLGRAAGGANQATRAALDNANAHTTDTQATQENTSSTQQNTSAVRTNTQNRQKENRLTKKGISTALTAIGTIGQMASMVLGEDNKEAQTWINAGSGAISTIGQVMSGNWVGAAMTAFSTITQFIANTSTNLREKAKQLEQNVSNTRNEYLKSNDEVKTLRKYKQQYDALRQSQYESNEEKQRFIDLQNEIAEKYPSFIESIDKEGNYVVKLTSAYDALLEQKEKLNTLNLVAAQAAEIEAAGNDYYNLKDLDDYIKVAKGDLAPGREGRDKFTQSWEGWRSLFKGVRSNSAEAAQLIMSDLVSSHGKFGSLESSWVTRNDVVNALLQRSSGDAGVFNSNSNTANAINNLRQTDWGSDIVSTLTEYEKNDPLRILRKVLNYALDTGKSLQEVSKMITKVWGPEAWGNNQAQLLDANLWNNATLLHVVGPSIETIQSDTIKSANRQLLNDQLGKEKAREGAIEYSNIQQDFLAEWVNTQWEAFYSAELAAEMEIQDAWQVFALNENLFTGTGYQEIQQQAASLYGTMSTVQIELGNTLYDNIELYSNALLKQFLSDTSISDSYKELFNKKLLENYNRGSQQKYAELLNNLTQGEISGVTQQYFENLYMGLSLTAQDDLVHIISQINKRTYLNNDNRNKQVAGLLNAYYGLRQELNAEIYQNIANTLSEFDVSSLLSYYETRNKIKELDPNLSGVITGLAEIKAGIEINLNTEVNNYVSMLSKNLENIQKSVEQALGGMSLEEAKSLANRLNKNLSDFTFIDGKFFYDNQEEIFNSYIKVGREYLNDLQVEFDRQIAELENSDLSDEVRGEKILELESLRQEIIATEKYIGRTIQSAAEKSLKTTKDNIQSVFSNAFKNKNLQMSDFETIKDIIEAYNLQDSGGNKLTLSMNDFSQTIEGLQLSTEKAIELYNALMQVDSALAGIVFNDIFSNITVPGNGFENISETMAQIVKTEKEIQDIQAHIAANSEMDNHVAEQKLTNLRQQLNLYMNIARVQSSNPESYNFMNRKLPNQFQGPLNYWNSVYSMFDTMKASAESGYIDLTDYYNIINEMSNIAQLTGHTMKFMGMEINGDATQAAELIEAGFRAMTLVDGEGAKIDLSGLANFGLDFSMSAQDMGAGIEAGLQDYARAQVDMLDGMISMLETIVAMEELGDIEIDGNSIQNTIFDMETIFGDVPNSQTFDQGWIDFLGNAGIQRVLAMASEDEELLKGLQSQTIGGISLYDLFTIQNPQKLLESGYTLEQYADAWEAFRKIIGRTDWNPEDFKSMLDMLAQGGMDLNDYQKLLAAGIPEQDIFLDKDGIYKAKATILADTEYTVQVVDGNIVYVDQAGQSITQEEYRNQVEDQIQEWIDQTYQGDALDLGNEFSINFQDLVKFSGLENIDILKEQAARYNFGIQQAANAMQASKANLQKAIESGMTFDNLRALWGSDKGLFQATFGFKFTDESGNTLDLATWSQRLSEIGATSPITPTVTLEGADAPILRKLFSNETITGSASVEVNQTQATGNASSFTLTYSPDAVQLTDGAGSSNVVHVGQREAEGTGNVTLTTVSASYNATEDTIELKDSAGNVIGQFERNGTGNFTIDGADMTAQYNNTSDSIQILDSTGEVIMEILRTAQGKFTIGNATATYDETTNQLTWVGADGNPLPDNYTLPMGEYGAEADINKVQVNWGANPEDIIKTQIPDIVSKDVWIYINPHEADWGIKEYGQRVQDYFNGIIYSSAEIESPIEGAVAAFEYFCKVVEQAPSIDIAQNLLGITEENWPQYQNLLIESSQALKLQLPGLDVESYNDFINTLSLLQEYFQNINRSEVNVDTENSEEKLNELSDATKQINDEIADVNNSTASPSTYTNPIDNLNNKLQTTLRLIGSVNSTKVNPKTSGSSIIDNVKNFFGANAAKGNTALAAGTQSTLMGELGPELYVTNGHYYVAGQNGAEFVDLPKDAIVFNHLQTRRLMQNGFSGRGKPITNEKNATSFAKGNYNGGSAKASASAALSALRQLRAQWQALAGMSVSDLAGKGGGGGGGGGKNDTAIFVRDVERWYNWLQKIARLEEQITYQEQLRSKLSSDFIPNGEAYYKSQMKSLEALKEQAATAESLAISQEEYFEKRRKELNENSPLNRFYTFDEYGKLIYEPSGFSELSQLFGRNDQGQPNLTAKEQYEWLVSQGFGDYMKYDNSGKEIKKEEDEDEETFYQNSVQAFSDRMDSEKEEMENLHDSIEEQKKAVLEKMQTANELLQEMQDNQIKVENSVLDAIIDIRDREIDEMEKQKDALKESTDKMIDGLTDALNREKKMYENQENENELNKMRRQLSILQRSGGSASQIASLQRDIESKERDAYFDKQQQQIDAIQEASDAEIERMDHQIEIAEETLEYQKEHGLLWEQVSQIMQGSPEAIAHFIMENNSSFWKDSPAMSQKNYRDTLFQAGEWTAMRDSIGNIYNALVSDWDIFNRAMEITFGDSWTKETANAVKETFENEIANSGDIAEAQKSVQKTEEYKTMKEEADKKAAAEEQNNSILQKKEDNTVKEEQADVWYQSDYTLAITTKEGKPGTYPGYGLGRTEQEALANAYYMSSHPKNLPEGAKINGLASGPSKPYKIYKSGGLIDYTGPAWVDGSKEEPESIWDAKTTALMKENLLNTDKLNLLKTFWDTLEQYNNNPLAGNTYVDKTESIIIENATVNMNVQQLANDYDARRAGETVMDEMVKIGRKNGFQNNIRR